MKKLLYILLLVLPFVARGQIKDIVRTFPTPLTGSLKNNVAVHDANLRVDYNFALPRHPSNGLYGAKDSSAYVYFNTTINKVIIYRGNSVWDTISTGQSVNSNPKIVYAGLTEASFRAAMYQAGTKGVVVLYPGNVYLQADGLVMPFDGIHIIGNNATLKRGPQQTTTLTASANTSSTSITVASVPTGWKIGDRVQLYTDSTIFTSTLFLGPRITGISGHVITFTPALQAAGTTTTWGIGATVRKVYMQLRAPQADSTGVSGFTVTNDFQIDNLIFDGNKANNKGNYYWGVNQAIWNNGHGKIFNSQFNNMPNENIIGSGFTIKNNYASQLNGSFHHMGGDYTQGDNDFNGEISGNTTHNTNLQSSALVTGHSEGVLVISYSAGRQMIHDNFFYDGKEALIGNIGPGGATTDGGTRNFIFHDNLARNFKQIVSGWFNTVVVTKKAGNFSMHDNILDSCGVNTVPSFVVGSRYDTLQIFNNNLWHGTTWTGIPNGARTVQPFYTDSLTAKGFVKSGSNANQLLSGDGSVNLAGYGILIGSHAIKADTTILLPKLNPGYSGTLSGARQVLTDGTSGYVMRNYTGGGGFATYPYLVTPGDNNFVFYTSSNGSTTKVSASTTLDLVINGTNKLVATSTGITVGGNLSATLPAYSSGTALGVVYNSTNNRFETGTGGGTTTNPLTFNYGFTSQPFTFDGSVARTVKVDTNKIVTRHNQDSTNLANTIYLKAGFFGGLGTSVSPVVIDTIHIQSKLLAGTNITITGNTISATGGSSLTAGRGIIIPSSVIKQDTTAVMRYINGFRVDKRFGINRYGLYNVDILADSTTSTPFVIRNTDQSIAFAVSHNESGGYTMLKGFNGDEYIRFVSGIVQLNTDFESDHAASFSPFNNSHTAAEFDGRTGQTADIIQVYDEKFGNLLMGTSGSGVGYFNRGATINTYGLSFNSTGSPTGPIIWNNTGSGFFTSLIAANPTTNASVTIANNSGIMALVSDIATSSHTIFTPTTGGTVTLVNGKYNIINPAGTLATLTVALPSSPANNNIVYIKYTQAVTSVTYSGGTVVGAVGSATAGGLTVLTYDAVTTSWY